MHDFRLQGTVFKKRFPPCRNTCKQSIFRSTHTGNRKMNMCTGKTLRTFSADLPLCFPDQDTHFFHCIQMQINRTCPDRTAAGITDPDPLTSSKHTSEQQDGRSHRARLFSGNTGLTDLITVQLQCMATPRGLYSHRPQDCFHFKHICNPGTVVKHGPSLMQHCSRHHWQGSILRSLNLYFSFQRTISTHPYFAHLFAPTCPVILFYAAREYLVTDNASPISPIKNNTDVPP